MKDIVPSSDPIGDELDLIDAQCASPYRSFASQASSSQKTSLQELRDLDDDSEDDALLLDTTPPLGRRPQRAAAQRSAPYSLKLSLTRPGDAATQRSRGMPKPLIDAIPRASSTRFSIESLLRDKTRRARARPFDPFPKHNVSGANTAPEKHRDDPFSHARSALESAELDAQTRHALLSMLAQDKGHTSIKAQRHKHAMTSSYWIRSMRADTVPEENVCIHGTKPQLSALHLSVAGASSLKSCHHNVKQLVMAAMQHDNDKLAVAARMHLASKPRDVLALVPSILSSLGTNEQLLALCFNSYRSDADVRSHAAAAHSRASPALHDASMWVLAPPREKCVKQLWNLLCSLNYHDTEAISEPELSSYIPMLLHFGACAMPELSPYELDAVLRTCMRRCTFTSELGSRIVNVGLCLQPREQVGFVRAMPVEESLHDTDGCGRHVRAAMASHLLLRRPWSGPHVDLHALNSLITDAPDAVLCTASNVPDARDYMALSAYTQLMSLALSDMTAMLRAGGASVLEELRTLVLRVWELRSSIQDHRGSHMDRSAVKDVVQRLGLRLWYQARNYVEGGHEHAALRPLLDGMLMINTRHANIPKPSICR